MTADLMTTYSDIVTAEQAAANGLRFLKEQGPRFGLDWKRISVHELDVSSIFACALAQSSPGAYPNYNDTLYRVTDGLGITNQRDVAVWAGQHGFNSRYVGRHQLNAAWRKLLRQERPWWKKPLAWIGR